MSDNYFQDRANKEHKPVYVGPDNLNGGSHWVYPQMQQSSHDTRQENSKLDRAIAEAEVEATTRDYRAKQPHNFDSTGAEESNEPSICALCGLDIKNEIHKAIAVLSIDGSHACALLGENIQDGEVEFVEINYPDGKNASDAYKHEKAVAFRALYKLRERLGIEITYALGKGL